MIDKVKSWVKDRHWVVIGCLVVLLMFKSCKVNFIERQMTYNTTKYELMLDSMQYTIDVYSLDNKDLYDSLSFIRAENNLLKELIKDIKKDKEYYRKQNRNLANVAEALSKKDTIK